MNRGIARAIACGILLVLPACQIPQLRPAATGLVLPASYDGAPSGTTNGTFSGSASPDSSAQLSVNEFYNDPILLRLVCQATLSNRELKTLEEEVQIARAEIMSRRGAIFPLAGFRAGAGWDRNSAFTPLGAAEKELEYSPGKHFPKTPGDFLLGFNFLVPVDLWRELRNARDAAIQRYFAAIERRNYFVTRMVADIAENYYALMALDQRLATLDRIIALQQQSLKVAEANLAAGRDTELPVQRFQAEVRKNQSEKLIVRQEIVEVENRINVLAGRPPQPVERDSAGFFDLSIHPLSAGVPAQLLLNRPDVRQAERELEAAGLDVKVARAHFFPRVDITGGVGYQAFNPRYLFEPEALILNAAGELAVPVINRAAIRAEYLGANARQLESVYNYQRVILEAFAELINRLSAVENYSRSIEIRRQQLQALEAAVTAATKLFQLPREKTRVDYLDVLTSQRDLLDARMVLIDTKRRQLAAIVNVYQALGGGSVVSCPPQDGHLDAPEPSRLPDDQQLPAPRPVPQPEQVPPPRPVPAGPKQPMGAVVPPPPVGLERMGAILNVPPSVGK
jgi:NodT family efflux transporter outer membrane factor (OMF) lipoprotein